MPSRNCGCGGSAQYTVTALDPNLRQVVVRCEACSGALMGMDGRVYPAHVTAVLVRFEQYQRWLDDGYAVTFQELS